jgi:enoyl-CoA hydratase
MAALIVSHPQVCLRNDRASVFAAEALDGRAALASEFEFGQATLASGESVQGATRFASGAGRHGAPAAPIDMSENGESHGAG